MTNGDKINKLSDEQVNSLLETDSDQNAEKIKILIVEDDYTTQLLYEKGLLNLVFEKKNGIFRKRRPAYL